MGYAWETRCGSEELVYQPIGSEARGVISADMDSRCKRDRRSSGSDSVSGQAERRTSRWLVRTTADDTNVDGGQTLRWTHCHTWC
jgi:hypothetical protein